MVVLVCFDIICPTQVRLVFECLEVSQVPAELSNLVGQESE